MLSLDSTYNWEANQWILPINLDVTQVLQQEISTGELKHSTRNTIMT
jgi:hypothetical protein